MKFKQIIVTILNKLNFLNTDQSLSLEALLIWIFLFITAFRAMFCNLTLNLGHDIHWQIEDINLASTLPVLYGLLSQAHKNYLNKGN